MYVHVHNSVVFFYADSSPEFVHTFIEQTLKAGPSISLTCSALGHPPPVITWTHDGVPLLNSQVTHSYQAYATGPQDRSRSSVTKRFTSERSSDELPPSYTSDIGASYQASRKSTYYSTDDEGRHRRGPSIGSWVDMGGHVVGQVNMSSVTAHDGGLYQCTASSDVGRVTHMARLNVFGEL